MSLKIEALRSNLLAGDRLALARAITLVESTRPDDQTLAGELLRSLSNDHQAMRIAISGPPGVGKSTFIDAFGELLLDAGNRVAVLAIDPSGQDAGGSILGDKTRMTFVGNNPQAFIRPSPSSGVLGGVANATYEVSLLCEAAGYNYILIETVGVGQSETVAFYLSDLFLVLLQPAAGDDLQGIKKGITERADLLVVNKWDGVLSAKAEQTRAAFQGIWGKEREVLLCSALEKRGLKAVLDSVNVASKHIDFASNRKKREVFWFKESCKRQLVDRIFTDFSDLFNDLSQAISHDQMHYTSAVDKVIHKIFG
ncbi:MAG: methylmalonyl Co-A mutase-associated GTPase MeaB [Saprospiraceae bacterium]|nr:methylmalonyl Co-A mutase-associated GTPase MeaB [Saprospiraceae bacterium]